MRTTIALLASLYTASLQAPMAIAQTAGTITKDEATAIVSRAIQSRHELLPTCFPLSSSGFSIKGKWIFLDASCRAGEALIVAILAYRNGSWTVACTHGDDVRPQSWAVGTCGMSKAEAKALGFPSWPDASQTRDMSNPVEVVNRYYALWNAGRYADMYAMLSAPYQRAHPFSAWRQQHSDTLSIDASASVTQDRSVVSIFVMSADQAALGAPGFSEYSGTWRLIQEDGAWKLDTNTLKKTL